LKEVLTFEPDFKERWDHQLRLCGLNWGDIRITAYEAAHITSGLFKDFHNIAISKRELRIEFQRFAVAPGARL